MVGLVGLVDLAGWFGLADLVNSSVFFQNLSVAIEIHLFYKLKQHNTIYTYIYRERERERKRERKRERYIERNMDITPGNPTMIYQ